MTLKRNKGRGSIVGKDVSNQAGQVQPPPPPGIGPRPTPPDREKLSTPGPVPEGVLVYPPGGTLK